MSLEISVDLKKKILALVQGRKTIKEYRVEVGSSATPTPTGRFEVKEIVLNPWWIPPKRFEKKPVPPGSENPLGAVKIRFHEDYLIHGVKPHITEATQLTSTNGCIKMLNEDVLDLVKRIEVGTRIKIR